MGQLDGKVAVVTGGGRGIGRAIALRYGAEGATVVVSSRTACRSRRHARHRRPRTHRGVAVVADATEEARADPAGTEAIERFGRVDVLVNNVGGTVGNNDPFTGDDDAFERTLVLCLTSAWWTTKAALPGMRDQGSGRIINIGSGASNHTGAVTPLHRGQARPRGPHQGAGQDDGPPRRERQRAVPGLDPHVAARLRAHRPGPGHDRRSRRRRGPRPRACRTGCSRPRSWPAWPRCSPATTAGASPARSSPSTAGTRSDHGTTRRTGGDRDRRRRGHRA